VSLETVESPSPLAPSWEECVDLLARLPALPVASRIDALERLVRNPSPGIREQALRIGASVLPDARLAEYLRADADATLRNAGAEIFRLRGGRSLPTVTALLQDPDPDVALQAVLILDRLRDPRALEPLHGVLHHADANVQQEAILAIGRLGDARSIRHLLPFLEADTWVQMAAVQALGDLRAPEAIPHLAARVSDEVLGTLAVEALARIGGVEAFLTLAQSWLDGRLTETDEETFLGLLAHVLEGLSGDWKTRAGNPAALVAALAERLEGDPGELRCAAARCLLVLGPSPWDVLAVEVLASSPAAAPGLPPALGERGDLIPRLLEFPGEARVWGLLLSPRYPAAVPLGGLLAAVRDAAEEKDLLAPLSRILDRVQMPGLGSTLLDLYLSLRPEARELLDPVLVHHGGELRAALRERPQVGAIERLVLTSLIGHDAGEVHAQLLALPAELQPAAVSRLMEDAVLVRRLPWAGWLAERPEDFAALAAEAAGRYGLGEHLPRLRELALLKPSAPLVRALGDLGDRAAVPTLLAVLAQRPDLSLVILESLGKIGGAEARQALRAALAGPITVPEARVACRALAACAEPEDDEVFREGSVHPDWYVRLAAAEGLARFGRRENLAALTRLAADPVAAVAHRALAALEE
jgi:HEAT repeat protein